MCMETRRLAGRLSFAAQFFSVPDSIYPVDARGLSTDPNASINIGTMREPAAQTGGKAFYIDNNLALMARRTPETVMS